MRAFLFLLFAATSGSLVCLACGSNGGADGSAFGDGSAGNVSSSGGGASSSSGASGGTGAGSSGDVTGSRDAGGSTAPCDPFVIDAALDGPLGGYAQYTCATLAKCCPLLATPIEGGVTISEGLCDDFVTYGSDIDCAGQEAIYRGYGYCLGHCP